MKIPRFWYYPEAPDSIHQLHPSYGHRLYILSR